MKKNKQQERFNQKNNPFSSPKACSDCHQRVAIGEKFKKRNIFLLILGIPLIYIPFFLGSWIALYFIGITCYGHLKLMGASNSLKKLKDFMPDSQSHRYSYKTQITTGVWCSLKRSKLFWLFNCTWYCPISVALLEWCSYLVKVVEVWWCPFHHSKKETYVPISQSFWHLNKKNTDKMHPEDRNNPIFVDTTKELE